MTEKVDEIDRPDSPAGGKEGEGTGAIQLKKEIGVLQGSSIIIGIIIGSGIFISPTGIVSEVNSVGAALLIWAWCGISSALLALCYAELGTTIVVSGGDYAYLKVIFSPFLAFIVLWMNIAFMQPCATAALALSFAEYVIQPFIHLFCADSFPTSLVSRMIALAVILLVSYINAHSVQFAAKTQVLFTATKVIALLVITFIGVYQVSNGKVDNFKNSFEGTNTGILPIAKAIMVGVFTYGGWDNLNFLTEELSNPFLTLPLAIFISMTLCTSIYLLVNVAYFSILTPYEMMASPAVANTVANIFLQPVPWIMSLFVICSVFGSINGCVLTSSRLYLVGARDKLLPSILSMIHIDKFTPVPAILIFTVLIVAMQQFSDIFLLMRYFSFVRYLSLGITLLGLVYFRYKEPDRFRPIRMPIVLPILMTIYCLLIVFVILYNDLDAVMFLLCGVITGAPIYIVMINMSRLSKYSFFKKLFQLTIGLQKMLMVVAPNDQ